jgi:hypothetical protein
MKTIFVNNSVAQQTSSAPSPTLFTTEYRFQLQISVPPFACLLKHLLAVTSAAASVRQRFPRFDVVRGWDLDGEGGGGGVVKKE